MGENEVLKDSLEQQMLGYTFFRQADKPMTTLWEIPA